MESRIFGYSREQVRKAQWDVLRALRKGLSHNPARPAAAQQQLDEFLDDFPEMDEPIGYAEALGQVLARPLLSTPQPRDTSRDSYEMCQRERHVLQLQVDYFLNHPLQEQLRERVEQINHWKNRAQEAEADNAKLKAALVREQNDHQATRSRLEGVIVEQRRLIFEQQETINACTH
ncbi:MAG: hypothetical protein ACP5J4_19405 [Anaerolineae bacterium]